VTISPLEPPGSSLWRRYVELTKPKIVALITFTALVGAVLARPGFPPPGVLAAALLGTALSAQCAAALNHLFDRHIDERMTRTRRRPLPTRRITTGHAVVFAAVLGVVGGAVLVECVNLVTAALTWIALIGYAVIYTAWLKHATHAFRSSVDRPCLARAAVMEAAFRGPCDAPASEPLVLPRVQPRLAPTIRCWSP